tara:strand:- start:148 stop:564 length:417 start_codon:yes stop_codon:yes gene_type:complete
MDDIGKTQQQAREDILKLESAVAELPQADQTMRLIHHFAPGLYARELFMAAGDTLIGKIHKHAHLNILLEGTVVVDTEFGRQHMTGPHIWVSVPYTKRAIYNQTDTRWITFHPTTLTDLDEIEAEVVAESYDNHLEKI